MTKIPKMCDYYVCLVVESKSVEMQHVISLGNRNFKNHINEGCKTSLLDSAYEVASSVNKGFLRLPSSGM